MHPVIFSEMLGHEAAHLLLTAEEKSEKETYIFTEGGLQEKKIKLYNSTRKRKIRLNQL